LAIGGESTGRNRPASLTALSAFDSSSLLPGKRLQRPASDIEREVPHCVALLSAGFRHGVELIASVAGELLGLVLIFECSSHRNERRCHHVGNERIVRQRLQAFRRLPGSFRKRGTGDLLLALLILLIIRFLLVFGHFFPLLGMGAERLIPFPVTSL